MTYQFKAYTADRRIVQGTIDAASEAQAEEALYQTGYQHVLSIRSRQPAPTIETLIPSLFGIRPRDVIELSRQMASFVASGISLLTALQLLEGQTERPAMQRVIAGLVKELQGGSSFSQALTHYPEVFPYSFCQVVRASEQAGELETGLRQASDYMERQLTIKSKIRRALSYPAFITVMAVAVFILMITVVLPPMVQLFSSLGANLPWTTRTVIAVMNFFTLYKLHVFIGIIVLVVAAIIYGRTPGGRLALDKLSLKTPLIGPVFLHRAMGQFCRTAAMLLRAGLPLPQILDVTIRTVSTNRLITQAFIEVRDKLVQGEGLSHPMSENALFPQMMVKMISIGEQTGDVDNAMSTLADFYENEANRKIQSLIGLIEPILTVVLGLAVAFILISIIMPLYSVLGAMR